MNIFRVIILYGAAGAVLAVPAAKASADDFRNCGLATGSIADCDQAIASGRYSGSDLARLYANRGSRYHLDRDQPDKAIADCSGAIRLDPKYVFAYRCRGDAWRSKNELDRAITDYDEAIRLDPNAAHYAARARAWRNKGEFDNAIADYTQAIRLDPVVTPYYVVRGIAWRYKGDLDRAIADFSETIRLTPEYDGAYRERGLTYLYGGAPAKALIDVNQASELRPTDAHYTLWVDIVAQRAGLPSRLVQAMARVDMTKWPAPVIRLFLGQLTPAAVLAAADDPNAEKKTDQVCEANFYSGIIARRNGAADEAAKFYRSAHDGCRGDMKWLANAELKQLGQ